MADPIPQPPGMIRDPVTRDYLRRLADDLNRRFDTLQQTQQTPYTADGLTTKVYDLLCGTATATVQNTADVLGTLITDLKAKGVIR